MHANSSITFFLDSPLPLLAPLPLAAGCLSPTLPWEVPLEVAAAAAAADVDAGVTVPGAPTNRTFLWLDGAADAAGPLPAATAVFWGVDAAASDPDEPS